MASRLIQVLDKLADLAYITIDAQLSQRNGDMPSQESIDNAFRTAIAGLEKAELEEVVFFILSNPEYAHSVIDEMIVAKGIEKAGTEPNAFIR